MKKTVAIFLSALCMLTLFTACGSTGTTPSASPKATETTPAATEKPAEDGAYDLSGQKAMKIVFAIPNGATNIETIYSENWMALVKERSNGLISFEYTNAGALGSYAELLEGIENGVYDMSITDPSYIQTYVPESVVLTLPLIFSDYDHAEAVFSGEIGTWYADLVAEQTNINVLNYYFCGFRYICSEAPINSMSDCKGVLIRSPQIQVYNDLLGLMGFSYVNMAWSEAYTAMSTGVINAVEVPLQNIYEAGFYDLATNICKTRHLLSVNCVIANEDFMNGLPAVYQDIMTDALAEVTADEHVAIAEKEAGYMTKLEEKGCTFTEFDDASKAALTETFTEYWYGKAESIGDEAIAKIDEIVALK